MLARANVPLELDADLERRFGGLRRLYGAEGYASIRAARIAVVGVGGVGSWAVEALARSGVAEIVLIDFDQVAESNINRQVQALSGTLGQSKIQALGERIRDIHPGCVVSGIEDFVTPENWPALMPQRVDVLIDACDEVPAKLALAAWALRERQRLVCVGAAGGKRRAERVQVADLAETTHDPLLARLRQRLRKDHGAPRGAPIGLRCVFSAEPVIRPEAGCGIDGEAAADNDSSLNCHGYGSTVTVTATFGLVAAGQALEWLLE